MNVVISVNRHYGALQGLGKKDTVDKYGLEQVNIWRRSYDVPPPECDADSPMAPANDPKYKDLPETHSIRTESLAVSIIIIAISSCNALSFSIQNVRSHLRELFHYGKKKSLLLSDLVKRLSLEPTVIIIILQH